MEMTGEMHPYFAQRSEIRYYDVKEGPVRS